MAKEYIGRIEALDACYNGWNMDAATIEAITVNIGRIPAADVVEQPRWIPVTERLPESGVHVLASCRVKYVSGGGRSYVCDAFYSGHFKEQRSTEYDDIELDYDEETDEYYLPEGWWEVIRNWDEYGFVGIADTITHWMPLPEPPKEE